MVRRATVADIAVLLELGAAFFAETVLGEFMTYDRDSTARTFEAMLQSPNSVILLAVRQGEVVGGAGAMCAPHYFNNNMLTCQELFWYVAPAHRGSADSARLIVELEHFAASRGAQLMALAAMSTSPASVAKFYQSRGYRETETYYLGRT